MPSLNYKKQFAPKILDGSKIHTIRRMRKRPFKADDRLYHFTGQRIKGGCIRLLENECVYVIDIFMKSIGLGLYKDIFIQIHLNDTEFIRIKYDDRKKLAINDGFNNYEDFKQFFIDSGLPFHGQLIGWTEYPGYGGIR
jgi:hypothetical protein